MLSNNALEGRLPDWCQGGHVVVKGMYLEGNSLSGASRGAGRGICVSAARQITVGVSAGGAGADYSFYSFH